MNVAITEGFRVLSAVAEGHHEPSAIASHLGFGVESVHAHIDRLTSAGLLTMEGERAILTQRTESLLSNLVYRSDLIELASPISAGLEDRLGTRVYLDVVRADDPCETCDGAFSVIRGPEGQTIIAPVLDAAGQIACVLRTVVDGMASEAVEVLGKELAVGAAEIAALLPQRKDRSGA